jgi:hypothetical protein
MYCLSADPKAVGKITLGFPTRCHGHSNDFGLWRGPAVRDEFDEVEGRIKPWCNGCRGTQACKMAFAGHFIKRLTGPKKGASRCCPKVTASETVDLSEPNDKARSGACLCYKCGEKRDGDTKGHFGSGGGKLPAVATKSGEMRRSRDRRNSCGSGAKIVQCCVNGLR